MQFQNCSKTGLTQNFVYSKRHCLRFVLESILRNQRPNFEKTRVKSQLGATCVENAGSRRSRICDSIPLLAVSHEMTGDPTFDGGSHLIACELLWLERMQSLSFVSGLPMVPCSSHQLPWTRSQWCFLKTSYLWFCLYCAFPRNHLGATSGTWLDGGEVCPGKPPKPFGRSAFSYWSLQTLPTLLPSSAETFAVQPIQEPKYFPPNCLLPCSCWRMRARAQYVPMKRQNLSKTLKVAKNLFQVINYLLSLLPVQFIMLLKTIAKK